MGRLQAAAIVAGAVAFLALVVVLSREKSKPEAELPAEAPAFTLDDAEGRTVALAGHRGRTVLLHFWATWCPPCVAESPELEALYRALGPQGLVLLAVSVDNDWGPVRRFVAQHGVTYPVLLDPQAEVAHRYGTYKYPESYLVGGNGRVLRRWVGPVSWSDPAVRSTLLAALPHPV